VVGSPGKTHEHQYGESSTESIEWFREDDEKPASSESEEEAKAAAPKRLTQDSLAMLVKGAIECDASPLVTKTLGRERKR
jgi:hypothetical protein